MFLFGRFLTLARVIKKNGGMVSFEWPPTVSGWKEPLVVRGLIELGCESVDIHGCYFGFKSVRDPNVFIKKGWRIATSCDELISVKQMPMPRRSPTFPMYGS